MFSHVCGRQFLGLGDGHDAVDKLNTHAGLSPVIVVKLLIGKAIVHLAHCLLYVLRGLLYLGGHQQMADITSIAKGKSS